MKKRKLLLFPLALSLALTIGCSSGEGGGEEIKVPTTPLESWQSFTLVRPDSAGDATVQAAVDLKKSIAQITGSELTLTTDWVKRGEEPPAGTAEILVGATNRPESDIDLAYLDYTVAYTGGRVVINGGSGSAVASAAAWFAENCLSEGQISVPAEPYTYIADYPLREATLAGTPLSEYVVVYDITDSSQVTMAGEMALWLAERTGTYNEPSSKDADHAIRFNSSEENSMMDVSVTLSDGDILLNVSPSGAPISSAISLFYERVEAVGGSSVDTLGEPVSAAGENYLMATAEDIAAWRKLTDERIAAIKSTPNMEIPAKATVYYVSPNGSDTNNGKSPETPWKTLDKVNTIPTSTNANIYVCFERGGVWRGQIQAKAGVTYTAYGEGDKPVLLGSPENGADASKWSKTDAEGIWKYATKFDLDVGVVVFNEGEAHGIKAILRTVDGVQTNSTRKVPFNDYHDLEIDLEFYVQDGYVYLVSEENPGERFDSIEFSLRQNGFAVKGNGVTVDNFVIKYVASHGVGAGTVKNLTVQNCEFYWIGGGIQYIRDGNTVRYGNGVEIYGGCDNYNVLDCYFYQIYDAAITHQYSLTDEQIEKGADGPLYDMKNVTYRGNVTEYCNYSIEYFLGKVPEENPSRMENVLIEDNYMWYAGMGLCEQRPDGGSGAHIKGWHHTNRATGFVIKDNLMIDSEAHLLHIFSNRLNPDGSDSMPSMENNIYAGRLGGSLGYFGQSQSEQVLYNLSAEEYLDGKSSGEKFYFIDIEKTPTE
ncbi:MAG: hypothetical protein IJ493_07040 [Clostridia bacterium]|nr:hypothetical protein [Clostridia bacterium]